jgi:mono/diheme cytochrome c family protein
MRKLSLFLILNLLFASAAIAQSAGEGLFKERCVACHGTDLSGHTNFGKKATIPDLRTAAVQSRSDGDLFASIGRGEGHKEYPHGFLSRGLNQVQLKSIIEYIRSQSIVAAAKK